MARAHAFVKRNRAWIGFNDHPNRPGTSGRSGCPREQQAAHPGSQQRGLNKELQQIGLHVDDLDLNQPGNRRSALGHLKVGGLEFVGSRVNSARHAVMNASS